MNCYTQIQHICQIKSVYDFKLTSNPHDVSAKWYLHTCDMISHCLTWLTRLENTVMTSGQLMNTLNDIIERCHNRHE